WIADFAFFFFSSRRRHTRSDRDWSSDVCSSDLCGLTTQHRCCAFGHPFSRSYGANVPSSLERFLSRALVYSTHPPVSVYGTGTLLYPPAFLDRSFSDALWPKPGLRLSMT